MSFPRLSVGLNGAHWNANDTASDESIWAKMSMA